MRLFSASISSRPYIYFSMMERLFGWTTLLVVIVIPFQDRHMQSVKICYKKVITK